MFTFSMTKKPIFTNHSINEYCRNSLKMSIQKITKQADHNRNKKYENLITNFENNPDYSKNIYPFLFFLSITSLTYCFYKQIC
jgi:hypothetical protein